jgi:glycyl-tRNA synthetase beta chain
LREPSERELHQGLAALRPRVEAALASRQYGQALDLLAGLGATVDQFFEHVLVNDPDPALRNNRMALLVQLRALFAGIADLSRLPG